MVCDNAGEIVLDPNNKVLILVLMEYGLRLHVVAIHQGVDVMS